MSIVKPIEEKRRRDLADKIGLKFFKTNPFSEKIRGCLKESGDPAELKVDVEADLPDSVVKSFLLQSRNIKGYSIAVCGSSIRDLVVGAEHMLGDLDLAVGAPRGEQSIGVHEDVFYSGFTEKARSVFGPGFQGGRFRDMMHLSSLRWLHRRDDGRWMFNKKTMASQYTYDYVGLMNDGQVIDPYGGLKDMFDGLVRLDFTSKKFRAESKADYLEDLNDETYLRNHALKFTTYVRSLFPKYKWGHSLEPETRMRLRSVEPIFDCSEYELDVLGRAVLWSPDTVTLIEDLNDLRLINPLRKAYQGAEKTPALTGEGRVLEEKHKAGVKISPSDNQTRVVLKRQLMEEWIGALPKRHRMALREELRKQP
ncbi:MAG: hypothetical protein GF334_04150 [Candidatus Altiarchaeales archaeon]|nr:hypothetical protein [Candidatus Altiarchaeales archaeon]